MASRLEDRLIERRRRRRRHLWTAVVVLVLFAVAAGVLSYWWFGGKITAVRPVVKRTQETEHYITPPNKLNILIMGVDDRPKEDDPGRSDTLMVMTLDTESREASIIRYHGTHASGQGPGMGQGEPCLSRGQGRN